MPLPQADAPVLKIIVAEEDGIDRDNHPVRMGVPFPQGYLHSGEDLRLICGDGVPLPLQTRVTARWADGSVKWILLDFFVRLGANSQIVLSVVKTGETSDSAFPSLVMEENPQKITIKTGAISYGINRETDIFFSSIIAGDITILAAAGWDVTLRDENGFRLQHDIVSWQVEESGPLRTTLRCDGRFYAAKKNRFLNFTARHTVFAGLGLITTDFIIHNPRAAVHPGGLWDLGDPGSFFFKELSISFVAADSPEKIEWQAEKETALIESEQTGWHLYQDSSGGENWNCVNHIDYNGKLTTRFRGYRAAASPEKIGQGPYSEGLRATPWVRTISEHRWSGGAIAEFWQNFPKSLHAHNSRLLFGLFPADSNQHYELQGGEQKRHTLFFNFGGAGEKTILPAMHHGLHVHIAPEWVEFSRAIPYFLPENKDENATYLTYVKNCIDGPHSFFTKREKIDEYGWRNYGDIYADHEAVHHNGADAFISHYNNQYDFIHGSLVHFLRSGDNRWLALASPAARHMIDIDIYHTDEDKPAYNHGLFWHTDHYCPAHTCSHRGYSCRNKPSGQQYGGGTSNENIYSSGLLLYYYLSGDQTAKEAVRELAEYVLAMDDGTKTIFSFIDEGPTGLASQTVATDFHKPGRGAGNCINCLMDAYRLTKERKYLEKAHELLCRCIHPQDDMSLLHLDDPEYRWSYLVFLQVVGKFLDLKEEIAEQDYYFFYARDSLLHYSTWMAAHEVPYKDVLHKVLIPTETWPAQDIRKCHVFHLAARFCPDSARELFLGRAEFFFQRCLEDLFGFQTRFLTRPLVLLLVYGYVHSFFSKINHEDKYFPHCHDFGVPMHFIPQRQRIKMTLMNKGNEMIRLLKVLFLNRFLSWKK